MPDSAEVEDAAASMRRINAAWLAGAVDDLVPLLHQDVVMAFPGFAGAVQGRDGVLAGFHDFCENAKIEHFREYDHRVDVVGEVAVVTFRFEMVYERSGERSRSTGRDMWVLQREGRRWIAVWRTMLDVQETPA